MLAAALDQPGKSLRRGNYDYDVRREELKKDGDRA
jgi:hypothetical protein